MHKWDIFNEIQQQLKNVHKMANSNFTQKHPKCEFQDVTLHSSLLCGWSINLFGEKMAMTKQSEKTLKSSFCGLTLQIKSVDRGSAWSQWHLSLTTKCRLYSSCILAVLLYACEMWTLTKVHWKRLESFHLRCQRRILGIKWSDFITNTEVYTRSGLQSIQSIVHRRRLSLFSHIARMPDNVPAKAVMRVACDVRDGVPPFPNWHRSRAVLPSPGCTRFVQTDCALSAGDALNWAQDRAVWRTYTITSSATHWRRRHISPPNTCTNIKQTNNTLNAI